VLYCSILWQWWSVGSVLLLHPSLVCLTVFLLPLFPRLLLLLPLLVMLLLPSFSSFES
jgi:hypothetical protein